MANFIERPRYFARWEGDGNYYRLTGGNSDFTCRSGLCRQYNLDPNGGSALQWEDIAAH